MKLSRRQLLKFAPALVATPVISATASTPRLPVKKALKSVKSVTMFGGVNDIDVSVPMDALHVEKLVAAIKEAVADREIIVIDQVKR